MTSYEEIIESWIKAKNPRRLLDLTYYNEEELPELPDTVEWLDISDSCILHLKNLPSSLKWLRCRYSNIISVELPLPSNLHYFDARKCENLLPFDIPKHITFLSDIEKYTTETRYEKEYCNENYDEHYQFAIRRIEEWKLENMKKNIRKPLNLSWLHIKDYSIIPDEVEYLITSGNSNLISLQTIPRRLKKLEYDEFPFKELNGLSDGLEYLEIKRSKIEVIDNLPNTIKKLILRDNSSNLIIKNLPENLKELHIKSRKDTVIECDFPLKLRKLYFKLNLHNHYIPIFPDSLHYIDLTFTIISKILYLPSNLKILMLGKYLECSLPLLPDGLLLLEISDIKKLDNNILPCSLKWINTSQLAFIDKKFRHYTIITG